MSKAKDLATMLEFDFKLYDEPGAQKMNDKLTKELDALAKRTGKEVTNILKQYRRLGAEDTQSRELVHTYFSQAIWDSM